MTEPTDAAGIGRWVAEWIGGASDAARNDTGAPEQRIETSVERLGHAVVAAIAKFGTPAVKMEPALHQYQASDGTWKDFDSERHRRDTVAAGYPVRTLYTVTHVQAGAVPMTPEQIVDAFCKQPHTVQFVEAFINGVRFAERHHGIKGSQHER